MDEIKPHKKKRHKWRTFKEFSIQCGANIKKLFKGLFILSLLGAFVEFGCYIVDSKSHMELTVIICFMVTYFGNKQFNSLSKEP